MKHLRDLDLSYFEHMRKAFSHIVECQKVSFKLFIHAIFPSIWEDTGWKNLGK